MPIACVLILLFFKFCSSTIYISHLSSNFLNMIYISSLKSHGSTVLLYSYSSFALSCQRNQVTRNVDALLKEEWVRGERQICLVQYFQRTHIALRKTLQYAADSVCINDERKKKIGSGEENGSFVLRFPFLGHSI